MIFSSLPALVAFFFFQGFTALNHLTGCILPFCSSAVKSFVLSSALFFYCQPAWLLILLYMQKTCLSGHYSKNNDKSLKAWKISAFQTAAGWTSRSTASSDS